MPNRKTSLLGGSGGSLDKFDLRNFDILASDERKNGNPKSRLIEAGKVVLDQDFSTGFEGWADHISGTTPQNVLSLSGGYPAFNSANSLMFSPSDPGLPDKGAGGYCRFAQYEPDDIINFRFAFAIAGDGAFEQNTLDKIPFKNVTFFVDTQPFSVGDRTKRPYFQIQWTKDGSNYPYWAYRRSDGQWVPIPNTNHINLGLNERKWGYNIGSYIVAPSRNDKQGANIQFSMNGFIFDLADAVPYQHDRYEGAAWDWFSGGRNVGAGLSRDSADSSTPTLARDTAYRVKMSLGRVLVTAGDLIA